jgi:hypothetical protein
MSVIAVLESGERIPLTDGWDEARRLFKAGDYSDEVIKLEQSEAPGSASPEMDMERTQARMEGL